jgi:hypothetical protein
MALTRTAAQLETSARSRADLVGSAFRSQATIFEYLSASCRDLVSMLCRLDDYWTATTTVNTVASTPSSAFPTAAWKLIALRVTLDGKRDRVPLASVDDVDMETSPLGWSGSRWPSYRLRGESLIWVPTPTAVHTVTVDYVPVAVFKNSGGTAISSLSATTDTFDGVFGWEDWVVLHTAIKLKSDGGKDTAQLQAELQAREASLVLAAQERAAEEPHKIRDTWRSGYEDEESDYA